jgi:hypothetical protein
LSDSLVAEEAQSDADGFFSHNAIDAGLGSQLSNQFVHIAPPSAGTCRFSPVPCLKIDLERLRSELQAMTAHGSNFLLRSHAKCCSNARVDARFTQCFRSAP